jgi:uncharacterized membrane protein YbhN (UPF0104 family)
MTEGHSEAAPLPSHGVGASGGAAGVVSRAVAAVREGGRGLFGPFALAWLIAIAMIVQLVRQGGFWQVAANTRVLDFLGRAGLIRLTDADIGSFFGGLPDSKFFVQSNDYIDWIVVIGAMGVIMLVWWLKAVQFHSLARFCCTHGGHRQGTFDQHARAYFYGHAIGRLFPYNMGNVASAAALERQGMPLEGASQVVYVASMFVVFETLVFALYGLLALGYTKWLAEIAWPALVLGLALLITRASRGGNGISLRRHFNYSRQAVRALAVDRLLLTKLAVLSIVSFLCVEFSVYLITQAFTTTFVILNVQFSVIVMAVVGGYLARLVQVTPGGLGQWEWGFALPLYVSGMGMPEAVTIALLMTAVRYVTGGLFFALMMAVRGIETNLDRVFEIFKSPEPEPESGVV